MEHPCENYEYCACPKCVNLDACNPCEECVGVPILVHDCIDCELEDDEIEDGEDNG